MEKVQLFNVALLVNVSPLDCISLQVSIMIYIESIYLTLNEENNKIPYSIPYQPPPPLV